MSEKEVHDAGREALRESVDRVLPTGEREEELLRYLGGVAYREHIEESREQRDLATEEDKR